MTDDSEIKTAAELYAVPLAGFTSARNALAAHLKARGDTAEAERVSGLRKPKISAWAINQLSRQHPAEVEALIETTERVAGASDAISMRDATKERQAALSKLSDLAGKVLIEGGHSASAGTIQEIVQTLQASSDPEVGESILRGDLTEPIAPTGFGFSVLDAATEDIELGTSAAETKRLKEQIGRLQKELDKAKALADERRSAADRAKQRAETTEADAIEAQEAVEALEAELIDLRGNDRRS